MLIKCINKIFALDGRSSTIEYSIITILLTAAVFSSLVAVGDSVSDFYLHMFSGAVASAR